jgi:hypothetical protein
VVCASTNFQANNFSGQFFHKSVNIHFVLGIVKDLKRINGIRNDLLQLIIHICTFQKKKNQTKNLQAKPVLAIIQQEHTLCATAHQMSLLCRGPKPSQLASWVTPCLRLGVVPVRYSSKKKTLEKYGAKAAKSGKNKNDFLSKARHGEQDKKKTKVIEIYCIKLSLSI